jgi:hypothetical protein
MYDRSTFAALPVNTCKDNLRFDQLADHEYFGDAFKDRKNSVAICIDDRTGKLHAVWSYGNWETFLPEIKARNGQITLQHTQTGRCTHLRLITYFMHGTKEHRRLMDQQPDVKLKQWTLK